MGISTALASLLNKPGETHEVTNLRRLTSGASMETWAFDYQQQPFILRRLPGAAAAESETGLGGGKIETEAEIIKFVGSKGLVVPHVLTTIPAGSPLGRGFVMSFADGTTEPARIQSHEEFADVRKNFIQDCARQLAILHKLDPHQAPKNLPEIDAETLLTQVRADYDEVGGCSVVFEIAFAWLRRHLPSHVPPRLVHADFRLGNLMFHPREGLTAILDWETACLGDPARDIAYIAVPSWRFGNHAQPIAGIGGWEEWLNAYQAEMNQTVDIKRIKFWLILSCLWWGVVCLRMVGFWRSGMDRSLERCMIGTRVSEVELDLLDLLEDAENLSAPPLVWSLPDVPPSHGETQIAELSKAVAEWLTETILPAQTGRTRFEALVARNAQRILEREAQFGYIFRARAAFRRSQIDLSPDALLEQAHNGTLDLRNIEILTHLRLSVLETLSIHQPKYPGFEYILEKWKKGKLP